MNLRPTATRLRPVRPVPGIAPVKEKAQRTSLLPVLVTLYCVLVSPLLIVLFSVDASGTTITTLQENKIVWPIFMAFTIGTAVRHSAAGGRWDYPLHLRTLAVYLALALASVVWAFAPDLTFIRALQQIMVVTTIALPALLVGRNDDTIRAMFLSFAIAAFVNLLFWAGELETIAGNPAAGAKGYFLGKNYLGSFAGVALLLSLNEVFHSGWRRITGIAVGALSLYLLIIANSKTAIGLAIFAPLAGAVMLFAKRSLRVSPAVVVVLVVAAYYAVETVTGVGMARISFMLYGDSTFTGRAVIWDFLSSQIAERPLLGWGYQSFWLVGPNGPSILYAPGWVKSMPEGHSGYYDALVELGYAGFTLQVGFILATLHAIGRVAEKMPARAFILLALAIFAIINNGLESLFMRGYEFTWIAFLGLAVDAAQRARADVPGEADVPGDKRMRASSAYRPANLVPTRGIAAAR